MTVKEKNAEGLVAYPFAGNAGCACYTFDANATAASLAADPTLFNDWGTMAKVIADNSQAPVEVTFESNVTIPSGIFTFPSGSKFIGAASFFPELTLSAGARLRGVQYFSDFGVKNTLDTGTIAGESNGDTTWMVFEGCEFNANQPVTVFTKAEAVLSLTSCSDNNAVGVGGTGPVFEFKGANEFQLVADGGTVIRSDALKCENVAGTLFVSLGDGAACSSLQSNKGASFNIVNAANPSVYGARNRSGVTLTGDAIWPIAGPDDGMQLTTASIFIDNTSGAGVNLQVGRSTEFSEGQIVYIANVSPGGAGNVVNLQHPSGNAFLTIKPYGAGAGTLNCVIAMWMLHG